MRKVGPIIGIALLGLALFAGYHVVKTQVESDEYQKRLITLRNDYENLRGAHNEAVKKTAVTELLVNEDGTVCVVFVTMNGEEKVVPTQFKMGTEIFADFIMIEGTAYFRRVFDENTKPVDALYIDPQLQTVEWKKATEDRPTGNIAYALLDEPGRWVVTVTGNKSLDIRKKNEDEAPTVLVPNVKVKDYSQVEKEVNESISKITFGDVMGKLFGSGDGE